MALFGDRVNVGRRIPWRAILGLAAVFAVLASMGSIAFGPAAVGWVAASLALILLGGWSGKRSPGDREAGQPSTEGPSAAAVIRTLPGPALLIGPDDAIAAFNAQALELMAGLAVGMPISSANRNPGLLAAIREARAGGERQRLRYEERVPIERRVEAVVAPVEIGGTDSAHLLVALRDLTEEARVEQMRADFVANASHELRTPLASLRGFIETLQGPARNDPEARDRFLGVMASQATRMTRLIDDLMSLSRIEMREHVAPSGTADVTQIVRAVAQMLEPLASEAKVRLEIAPMEASLLVRGDAQEIEQVVLNLAQNAIKYGRPGGHVLISTRQSADRGGRVLVSIADDGPGIAAEHLPRLTERFYRVDVPESRNRGGTGLGLAIVKHILNRHRGELLIRSEVGKGSTFTAVLPDTKNIKQYQ